MAPVLRTWSRLHADRPYTVFGISAPMGGTILKSRPGMIPWSVIDRWCERHRLRVDEAAFLERCIGVLDEEYLAWWASQEGK